MAEESVETRGRERASRRVEEREWNRRGNGKGQDKVKSGKGERKGRDCFGELEGGVGGARARVMCPIQLLHLMHTKHQVGHPIPHSHLVLNP